MKYLETILSENKLDYSQLITLLYDLADLTGISAEDMIRILDQIDSSDV